MSWMRERRNDRLVVHVPNVLIAKNREDLKNRVVEEIDRGERRLLIDFSDTQYVDSSGLGLLVSLTKRLAAVGGELCLANLNEDLRTLLALSKLDTVLLLLPDEDGDGSGGAGRTAPLPRPPSPTLHTSDGGS
jgi:anti-sigma B factor antagonist